MVSFTGADYISSEVPHTTATSSALHWLTGYRSRGDLAKPKDSGSSQIHLQRTTMVANKQITSFFFAPLGRGLFRCNLCRQDLPGSGYSNLITHLAGQRAGYEAQYAASISSESHSLQSFGFVCEKASHLFQWIQWIIERNMTIHEVEDALTRAMSKLRPVTVQAVKKCMEGIVSAIGEMRKEREEECASLLLRSGGRRRPQADTTTVYLPLVKLIPPSSNKVERLFSQCKLVMTPQCRSMLPVNFEQLLFLHANRSMWDVTTVASICEESSA